MDLASIDRLRIINPQFINVGNNRDCIKVNHSNHVDLIYQVSHTTSARKFLQRLIQSVTNNNQTTSADGNSYVSINGTGYDFQSQANQQPSGDWELGKLVRNIADDTTWLRYEINKWIKISDGKCLGEVSALSGTETIAEKIELFDADGTLIGYIPIFSLPA
ncbi:MAG: hypothetical protein AAGH46_05265 [Bacteroidota bacterium]